MLTKAQLAILAEMARTGEPLEQTGRLWRVGECRTSSMLAAHMTAFRLLAVGENRGRRTRILTDAGRAEGECELACKGLAPAGWVRFGDVARDRCGQQAQYASRYIDGRGEYPHLGAGLRFRGRVEDYHFILIHADDVEESVRRWKAHENV